MNTTLRSRKVLIPAAVVVLLAAGGGVAWAEADSDDDQVTGAEATRIGNAAKTAARLPDARVIEVEKDSDDGVTTYEVTLDSGAGNRTEVELDTSLRPVRDSDSDDRDSDDRDSDSESGAESGAESEAPENQTLDSTERRVGDIVVDEEDGPVTDRDLEQAVAAATKAVPGGTVTEVSSSKPDADDKGLDLRKAWTVELTTGTGTARVEHEVDLDATFAVLRNSVD